MNTKKIRVMLADDDELVRLSLKMIIEADDQLQIVAQAADGQQVLEQYDTVKPDVLLMDIRMQPVDGLQAGEQLLHSHPEARLLYLTTFSDDTYIIRALRIGARGYILKQDYNSIVPSIKAICQNQSVFGDTIVERLPVLLIAENSAQKKQGEPSVPEAVRPFSKGEDKGSTIAAANTNGKVPLTKSCRPLHSAMRSKLLQHQLTDREIDVIEYVAQGLNNKEISAAIHLGEGTVRNHLSVILDKLGLRDRTQLAIFYFRQLDEAPQ